MPHGRQRVRDIEVGEVMKISVYRKFDLRSLSYFLPVMLAWPVSLGVAQIALADNGSFEKAYLFSTVDLNDMGVADIDADGLYDVFTINHSSLQEIRINNGDGSFSENRLDVLGLSQSAAYPGLEIRRQSLIADQPGIYIYFDYGALVLEVLGVSSGYPLRGRVSAPWAITGDMSGGSNALTLQESTSGSGSVSGIDFEFNESGVLAIHTRPKPTLGIPYRVRLNADRQPLPVFIGHRKIPEHSGEFELLLKDRHAMAFADVDGDGISDVFINRGGMRGRLSQVAPGLLDELYIYSGSRYHDRIGNSGITKAGCPGRGAQWVDIDSDGSLDLYQVCGRTREPSKHFPNRVFRQRAQGQYEDVGMSWGLDHPEPGAFAWVDWDGDDDQDMIWVTRGAAAVIENRGVDGFSELHEARLPGIDGVSAKPAIADFDNDGDFDLFVSDKARSYLIVNEHGRLRVIKPETVGLPGQARTAVWVDYDLDGKMDLHALPGGIYLQKVGGRFVANGDLSFGSLQSVKDARISWADLNDDGSLDAIVAVRSVAWIDRLKRMFGGGYDVGGWQVYRYLRGGAPANWLALRVDGAPGNRESYGAKVRLETADGASRIEQIGQFEGSHFSQGNRTLQFGLGNADRVRYIEVTWPDGRELRVDEPPVNQLLSVRHPDSTVENSP